MFEWTKLGRRDRALLLFCPVETKVRELDAKTLLACVAAERGHTVVLGDMVELRDIVEFLPRGVYLSKSIPRKMERYFRRYKSLGYGVAAWCEEGLVFFNREYYKREKVCVGTLRYADLFFAWGGNQARVIIEKAPDAENKVRQVGNPRMDMLNRTYRGLYKREADRLRSLYGGYILFNTNFSVANHKIGTEGAFLDAKKRGKFAGKDDEDRYWEFHDHRRVIFERTVDLVGAVSNAYPDRRVVVRPHPSENHDTWRDVTKEMSNVDVVFEGPVIPWIMSADVLIHSGCTTAVEAYFLETPAIVFRPVINEEYDFELPNRVSMESRDFDEVLNAIEIGLAKDEEYQGRRREAGESLGDYIAQVDGSCASDRIVDELEAHYRNEPITAENRLYPVARLAKRRVKDYLRAIKHARFMRRHDGVRPGEEYRRQKLPDIPIGEMEDLVASLKEQSGRFEHVHVRPLNGARRCYVIESR
jgi:surface carbohydrate biosynthesis protein